MTARSPATLSEDVRSAASRFVEQSRFATHGGIVTDLDGTAVHERDGRVVIAEPVEAGLKALAARGRPVVLNSLRFPLSIMRSFGREWHGVTGAPVPTVSLNGSLLGHIVADNGSLDFRFISPKRANCCTSFPPRSKRRQQPRRWSPSCHLPSFARTAAPR